MNDNVRIIEKPDLSNAELNDLFSVSWTAHTMRAFEPILQRSMTYFGAYQNSQLVGFVNVAWDGGDHAFLLDPTVLPACRRRGVGLALVEAAIKASATRGPNGFTSTMTQRWKISIAGQDSARLTPG